MCGYVWSDDGCSRDVFRESWFDACIEDGVDAILRDCTCAVFECDESGRCGVERGVIVIAKNGRLRGEMGGGVYLDTIRHECDGVWVAGD